MAGIEGLSITRVDKDNVNGFIELIVALAEFERLAPPDDQGKERLARDATSDPPLFQAFMAMVEGRPIGYITYYFTYSTFLARPTLFLEDIFLLEDHRRKGVGKMLFQHCADEAKRSGCGRMEWTALDWNVNAHKFYEEMGGRHLDWAYFRLSMDE